MDIRERIRKEFSKKSVLKEASRSKWDSDNQPNVYELDNFLRKSGYRLLDVLLSRDSDLHEILLEPIKPGYLYPEITHDIKDGIFYINVTNYGLLEASDVEGIIRGYENALAVVHHLQSLDLKKLEVTEDK